MFHSVVSYSPILLLAIVSPLITSSAAASLEIDHDPWESCDIPSLAGCQCGREPSESRPPDQQSAPKILAVSCVGVTNVTDLEDVPASVTDISFTGSDVIRSLTTSFFGGAARLGNLRKLNLSNNAIRSVDENAFVNLTNLEVLNMSNNKWEVGNKTSNVFAHLPNLQFLVLNSAFVPSSRVVNTPEEGERVLNHFVDLGLLFNDTKLPDLKRLYLDNNTLMFFAVENLKYMPSLQELSLADNLLTKIRFNGAYTPDLCDIRLDGNRIGVLSPKLRDDLGGLCKGVKVTETGGSGEGGRGELRLSLSGNSLLCACHEEEFVRWMKSKDSRYIVDRASLLCVRTERFTKNVTVLDVGMSDLDPEPCERPSMRSMRHAYGVLAFVIVLVVIVVGLVVLFRARKQCNARRAPPRQPQNQDVRHQKLESSAHYSKLDV